MADARTEAIEAMVMPKSVDLGRIDQWAVTDLRPLHRIAEEPTGG